MNTMPSGTPAADITVDGTGLLCVSLLLRLRKRIDGAAGPPPPTSSPPIRPPRSICPPGAT
ncbi:MULTISPECIES: hypothetical protein [Streptomyces]|uniref:hypothetical protein n=1 Tax=Streptomyces TaxID=1883 RepID=UPI001E445D28|nr:MULTISPECIES: hypothetical protein [Streptomyces]MDQ0297470.1 hypothetical protein [Streptomyces sp. DSM 41037]